MSRRFIILTLAMVSILEPSGSIFSQCSNQITVLPPTAMKPASRVRDFVRFRYPLSASDSLLIRAHEDTETSIGPYDTGFVITRNGKTIQSVILRELPVFRRENVLFSEAFSTFAVTRACTSEGSIYFVTMQYMGDDISPALTFILVRSGKAYEVSNLPMMSGGVLDVSKADPLHLRVWDNLHEGSCNACETAYKISEYEIRDGVPSAISDTASLHLRIFR